MRLDCLYKCVPSKRMPMKRFTCLATLLFGVALPSQARPVTATVYDGWYHGRVAYCGGTYHHQFCLSGSLTRPQNPHALQRSGFFVAAKFGYCAGMGRVAALCTIM